MVPTKNTRINDRQCQQMNEVHDQRLSNRFQT